MDIAPNLKEALTVLGTYTAGRYDVWLLAGNSRAGCRAHVMSVLQGIRVPQSKAGVNALRDALYQAAGIEGECLAEKDDKFLQFAKQLAEHPTDVNLPTTTTPSTTPGE
jgi:hypothetical protein